MLFVFELMTWRGVNPTSYILVFSKSFFYHKSVVWMKCFLKVCLKNIENESNFGEIEQKIKIKLQKCGFQKVLCS